MTQRLVYRRLIGVAGALVLTGLSCSIFVSAETVRQSSAVAAPDLSGGGRTTGPGCYSLQKPARGPDVQS
jgi:hypothetical protein